MQLTYVEYQDMLNSIEKIINQKLDSFITEFTNKIQKSKKLLTKTELCSALNISRPTLDNWLKNPTLKGVLKPVFEKRGARFFLMKMNSKRLLQKIPKYSQTEKIITINGHLKHLIGKRMFADITN